MRRFLIVFTIAGLSASLLAPAALARDLTQVPGARLAVSPVTQADKSLSGRIAQSDQDLLARRDNHIVNVMVKLDADAVASYQGGIDNLRATSPGVTGKTLGQNNAAVDAYKGYLGQRAANIRKAAKNAVPGLRLGRNFLIAYGGFSASLPANQARLLAKVPGVAAVQYDRLQQPQVDYSPHFVGADAVWPSLGGSTTAGEGVKVGVLDTGIWPEHPMLADLGISTPPGGPYDCQFGASGTPGDDPFICNDKMLGGYAFTDTYMAFTGAGADEFCDETVTSVDHPFGTCSPRDSDGHGTHTSTTAAGDLVASAVLLGVERGPVSGIAPGASVIMYRVCLAAGCYGSDSVSAVEQAILDDVDVINFSISGGSDPYSDPVELAFLDAYAAGIMVNASAGNSGPDAGTTDHGGPWTNTVGASTWDKAFGSTLHLTATGGPAPLTLDISGVTVTDGITTPTPVILASDAPYSDALCKSDPASATQFDGMILVCKRGTNARIDKGYRAFLGDAEGMILYNQNAATTDLESDNHFLPAIHTNYESDAIALFVAGHTGVMATWAGGTLAPAQGDVMASFSSRGPLGDFIKPDVTAPGVQILAGNTPDNRFDPADGLGPEGELYQAIAGTSMSSPHAAGVAALIKAAHPSWTPGEIKSAMMTSAVHNSATNVFKEDGVTPADPFDMGAGSIRANRAVDPTVVFDVSATDYFNTTYNQSTAVVLDRINLNLASIDAPIMPGIITATRTARNVSGHTVVLDLSADAPAGSSITLTPRKLTLAPNQRKSFSVRIEGSALADGWYFGSVTLNSRTAGDLNAVLPVAFNKTQGDVTFSNDCDDATVAKGDETTCHASATNYANGFADLSIRVKASNSRIKVNDWAVSDQGDPGRPQANKRGNGFLWNGWLTPAIPPEVISLTTPADTGGYDPIPSIHGPNLGDEGIVDVTGFDPFYFGGEMYTSVRVCANGYIVVGPGSGDTSDCQFIPQDLPDPAVPNNVLAPYWTDLDMSASTGGGDWYFNEYCADMGCTYGVIVIDFQEVQVYTSGEPRSFQILIFTAPFGDSSDSSTEHITFEYDGALGAGESTGLVVGAENRDGTSAATNGPMNTLPAAGGYIVNMGNPTPGGTVTIDYDVKGKKIGGAHLTSWMWTDIAPGKAKIITPITVTPPGP